MNEKTQSFLSEMVKVVARIADEVDNLKHGDTLGGRLADDASHLESQLSDAIRDEGSLKKPIFEGNQYFFVDGEKREGPYCTKCWDEDKLPIRLHAWNTGLNCPRCQTFVSREEGSVSYNQNS